MNHLARTTAVLLLVVGMLLMPTQALAAKQVYAANIFTVQGHRGAGSTMITVDPSAGFSYLLRTAFGFDAQAVTAVYLAPVDGSWQIPLCTNGGPVEDDCTYDAAGNLYLDGPIIGSMLIAAGVSGGQFFSALRNGQLTANLAGSSGVLASAQYVRII